MNVLSVTLVSGIFLISISALSQFSLPHLRKGRMHAQENSFLPSSEIQFAVNEPLDAAKVCICWKHYAGLVLSPYVLMSVCQCMCTLTLPVKSLELLEILLMA